MTKRSRHGAILELVQAASISTQSELASALAERGYQVTQTTVSRDISELGLEKVRGPSGQLVYSPPGTADFDQMSSMVIALQRWVLSIEPSGNLVVLRTPNGFADPVAQSIDQSGHPDIIGTVAGENTVLVVAAEGMRGEQLGKELESLIQTKESR